MAGMDGSFPPTVGSGDAAVQAAKRRVKEIEKSLFFISVNRSERS